MTRGISLPDKFTKRTRSAAAAPRWPPRARHQPAPALLQRQPGQRQRHLLQLPVSGNNVGSSGANRQRRQPTRSIQTWGAFQQLRAKGIARAVGVSNWDIRDLQQVYDVYHEYPSVNQIEIHPLWVSGWGWWRGWMDSR
jgi:diketogulonate reductase-like aldo/keto reductase